ncbi:MAG: response regulator transcription factor [Burkholderiaceae bacterium]
MVATIGADGFGQAFLSQLNRALPVSWWSVFHLPDGGTPAMPASGSYAVPDHTLASWHTYRSSLYRSDITFAAAREALARSGCLLVHWSSRELPRPHREQIYTRHGLRERLSVVSRTGDGALLAVNLYRHEHLKPFSDADIDFVRMASPLLSSCVRRHVELSSRAEAGKSPFEALTPREREVCERMLTGRTYEGIASELRISAGTVKTYRNRAFDRLGIQHRNQLFALALKSLGSKRQ